MYRYLLSLGVAACALTPALAQTADQIHDARPNTAAPALTGVLEPVAPITLEYALTLASSINAELSAAFNEAAAVDASIRQAGTRPNPEMSWLVEDTRRETRTTTIRLDQSIEFGGKRAARITAATRAHDAANAELNAKRADIRARVITTFFDVLSTQERLHLADTSLALAQRATHVATQRVAAGKVSPVEETRARIAEANIRMELTRAKSELTIARKRLAAIWGNPTPRFTRAEGAFETLPELPSWSDLESRLADAPGIVRARLEVDHRQALAQLENSRRTPDVTVSVGVKRDQEFGRNQAVLGLSIPLPFFDRNQGNMLEALRRTDKARDELSVTGMRLDGELAQSYERLSNARQAAETLQREILPGAQSAYEAASKGFAFGKFNFLDVLDAQRTLLQARSQYLHALSEAHQAAAEIDRILGIASSRSLAMPVVAKP